MRRLAALLVLIVIALLAVLGDLASELDIEIETSVLFDHPTITALALHLAGANSTHAVSYCTEAGLFQQIGIPAVICGPGSIEQAHKPDEWIETSELRKCETFMGKLVAQLS